MNQHNDHRLTHVAERDVDLLLIEEFCCSEAFFNWFAEQLRPVVGDAELQFVQARHSVSMSGEGSGETDIEVIALAKSAGSTCRLAILIEDKVDAEFTERQPDRYALRARQLVTGGICDRTILVLLAPAEYAGQGDDQFDVRIPYERVIDYFRSREDSLSGELMRAVSIGGGCWNKHKPGDSYSVPFPCLNQIAGVPRASLWHVMRKGTVDLLFAGSAAYLNEMSRRIAQYLDADMKPRRASKSLAVTIQVTPLDTLRPLAEQKALNSRSKPRCD